MVVMKRDARIAGLFYLLLAIVGPIRLMIIPNILFSSDPVATANNIASNELLFRFGIVSDLLVGVFGLITALALYRLFRNVSRLYAVLMVAFGGPIVTAIYFVNTLNDAAALMLAQGGTSLAGFTQDQRINLVTFFLNLHSYGQYVNEIFWGLWLLPMGILVYRSGFIPRGIGVYLLINGIAYLAASLTALLTPQYLGLVTSIIFPALLAEVVMVAWLLVKGVRAPAAVQVPP